MCRHPLRAAPAAFWQTERDPSRLGAYVAWLDNIVDTVVNSGSSLRTRAATAERDAVLEYLMAAL